MLFITYCASEYKRLHRTRKRRSQFPACLPLPHLFKKRIPHRPIYAQLPNPCRRLEHYPHHNGKPGRVRLSFFQFPRQKHTGFAIGAGFYLGAAVMCAVMLTVMLGSTVIRIAWEKRHLPFTSMWWHTTSPPSVKLLQIFRNGVFSISKVSPRPTIF
jgi:hypothetical protein